ncbi:hypothetical protein HYZ98_00345 [Candidatus Peregrinibacteria bacterium]|nr:hypothetical protein [Candidatus Peregrinibacteria bacterium]
MDYRLLIGVLGSALLVAGVANTDQRAKNILFAIGNAYMFLYALVGYLTGGPIFFLILQIFIALSTLCMLLRVPDTYDTPILAVGGIALVGWSLSLFQDYTTAIFVVGLALLGIGFAMESGTLKREMALMIGSMVIAVFSFLMRDWVFVGLNVLFAALALINVRQLAHR